MDPAGWTDYEDDQMPPELIPERQIMQEEYRACEMHWCLVVYGYPRTHLHKLAGDLYRGVEAYVNVDPPSPKQLQKLEDKFSHVVPSDFFEVVRQRRTWMKENPR